MTLTRAVPTEPVPAEASEAKQPWDVVDEWGLQSFPASDPPSNW